MAFSAGTPTGSQLPTGAPNINFSGVGGNIATQKVGLTIYDYDPFTVIRTIFERHNTKAGVFRMLLKALGGATGANAPTVGHYEADWKVNLVKIGSIITASTGAGTDVVVALHADMMYTPGVTVSGVAAKASAVRVNDVIQFKNGKRAIVTVKNTTTDPHRITLRPVDSTVDLVGAIVAAESYFISDNAYGEGTNLGEGVQPRFYKYTNEFQIVKESGGSTGSELTNQTFFQPVTNQDGSIYLRIKADMLSRFERSVSNALLFGKTINNVSVFNSEAGFDVPVKGTQGLIDFAETNGYTDNYTVGAYVLADFDVLGNILQQERIGTNQILTLDGYKIFLETENELQSKLSGDLTMALMNQMASNQSIASEVMEPFQNKDFGFYVGFQSLRKAGYNYYFRQMPEFNEAVGAGATGYTYPSYRIVVPIGSTTEKASGKSVPLVGYHYKQLGSYSRETVMGQFGGVGAEVMDACDGWDRVKAGLLSEVAGHFACPNQIIVQKP